MTQVLGSNLDDRAAFYSVVNILYADLLETFAKKYTKEGISLISLQPCMNHQ